MPNIHESPSRDLYRLLPFIYAVRGGSFFAAAAQLQVTPPAISKSIAALEGALGVRLFNRTTRQLHLTVEGRELFDRLEPLMSGIDDVVDAVRDTSTSPKGLVRVSVTPAFGRHGLLPVLPDFFASYPDVSVEVSLDEAPPSLVQQGFDLRIQHGQGRELSYVSRLLCTYPIVLVASPGYLERHGTPQAPRDLDAHQCIRLRMADGPVVWDLQRVGLAEPSPPHEDDHYVHVPKGQLAVAGQLDASLIVAVNGGGIVPSSELVVTPLVKAGALKLVLPDYRINVASSGVNDIYVHYAHRKHLSAKVQVFLKFLYARFGSEAMAEEKIKTH